MNGIFANRPISKVRIPCPVFLLTALAIGAGLIPVGNGIPTVRAIEAEVQALSAFTSARVLLPSMATNQPYVPADCSQMTRSEFLKIRIGSQSMPGQVSVTQLCYDWLQVRDSSGDTRRIAITQRSRHIFQWLESLSWSQFAGSAAVHISKNEDPEGYDLVKSFWLAATEKQDVPLEVLQNAESFFERDHKLLAEQILLRMRPLFVGFNYPQKFGRFYAMSLANVYDIEQLPTQRNWDLVSVYPLRPNALKVARTPFARKVLRQLEKSQDDRLLAETGLYLVALSRLNQNSQLWELGIGYAKHSTELNPDSKRSREILDMGLLIRDPYVVQR
jgi:hypothetical protein